MSFRLLFLFLPFLVFSQTIEVPDEMYFLDMKIYIKNSVKDDIANSIMLLRKNKAYYQSKLDRVDAYFPIIERVLQREGVPDDFKFLVIQESSLVSDAVSSSNAVGFWQFKREAALEHGLRVDGLVDERKNISASTRAAASYLKKSNAVFNNWIYSMQSYNVGLGGTQRSVDTRYYGAKEMEIDKNTHWYIVKCIAHKLAFGDDEGKNTAPPLFLFEYTNAAGKTWKDIALELQVDEEKLKEYNKWLKYHTVPDDKNYLITVPASYLEKDAIASKIGTLPSAISSTTAPIVAKRDVKPLPEPKELTNRALAMYPGEKPTFVLHNGLEAIQAKAGDDINKLAIQAGISRSRFLRYNDLRVFDEISPNEYYYIESKKNKAIQLFHVVKEGESLRDISQLYGVTISALLRKNRMKKGEPLQPGRELWLRNKRPENVPVKIVKLPVAQKRTLDVPKQNHPKISYEEPKRPTDTLPVTPKPSLVTDPVYKPLSKDSAVLAPSESKLKPKVLTTYAKPIASNTTSGTKDTIHVVQPKETLYSIARMYNTRPDSIRSWNKIDSTGLKIAQVLQIKKHVLENNLNFINHTVAPGETLYRIADLYKVSVQEIQEWNRKEGFTLAVGEVVRIKRKSFKQ